MSKVNSNKPVSRQVQVVITPTQNGPMFGLQCPACTAAIVQIGAKFCSNCGKTLVWDHIWVNQPTSATPDQALDQTLEEE